MNKKVKDYAEFLDIFYEMEKRNLWKLLKKSNDVIDSLEFITFSNKDPYEGSTSNLIFFTYSDHYKGNSGIFMQFCKLHKPHYEEYDRGYIKGVAVDLDNYLKLKSIQINFDSNTFNATLMRSEPKFRKSKYKENYELDCFKLRFDCINNLAELYVESNNKLNKRLKELTGCSLLYYIS